ncbi:hypothetical protein AWN76_006640 [Rhodothermaceae bacterium RA]|nr:hypothetical protein AWN76_006640 [Rhodothermaceae bacterium RA]
MGAALGPLARPACPPRPPRSADDGPARRRPRRDGGPAAPLRTHPAGQPHRHLRRRCPPGGPPAHLRQPGLRGADRLPGRGGHRPELPLPARLRARSRGAGHRASGHPTGPTLYRRTAQRPQGRHAVLEPPHPRPRHRPGRSDHPFRRAATRRDGNPPARPRARARRPPARSDPDRTARHGGPGEPGWPHHRLPRRAPGRSAGTGRRVRGAPPAGTVAPPQGTRLMQHVQQALDAGRIEQVEYALPHPDGPRHYEARLVRADDDEVVVSIRDISERKRAEAELRQSTSRLREAQHLAHIGDWGLDVETGTLNWSDEVFHLFERAPEAGPPSLDEALACFPPDDRARLDQARSRTIQTGRAYALDLCLELPSGTRRYVHERGRGVRNEAGQVVRLIGTILDITERKQAELALQASEERFRLLAENMQEFVCLHEPDGTYVWVSPSVKDLLGYEPDELIGQDPYTYFHPDDVERIRKHAHRPVLGAASLEGVTIRYRYRHRDGSYVWLETLTRAILNDEGNVIRLQTSSRDVSSKVAAEEALETERNLLRTLIDTLPDSIFVKDAVGRYVLCNTAHLRRLRAASLEDVIGRTVLDFYPESVAQTYYEEDLELIRTGASIIDHTHQGLDEQGQLSRWMRVTQVPLRNPAGKIVGLVGVARDVTEEHDRQEALRRYAEDLEQAKQVHEAQANELARMVEELEEARRTAEEARRTAEEATRVKSDFLAMMSHEIRTPMSGVIGMTDLLLDTTLDAEQQELVHVIRSSGETLLTILNDILDFSKIEAGRIELETHPFDLHTLLEDALQLIAGKAADRDIELVCRLSGEVPRFVAGDPTRVRQIVNNLLSNAVKFTEAGEVVLSAGATSREDRRVELHVSVRDTGIGMAPEALDRLFEPFSQAQALTTRRYGGTGLGLAICRRLSTLMDGRIWAESEEGVGSTFHVTLCLTPTEPPSEEPPGEAAPDPTESLQGRRLLIVDDHAASREVLAELTTAWGMQVQAVDSGIAALRRLNDAPGYDVVLIDRHMPRMDGLMLIRAMAPQHPNLPLILMHPFGRREHDPRLTDQLSKPIRRAALARTLAAALSRPPTPDPGGVGSGEADSAAPSETEASSAPASGSIAPAEEASPAPASTAKHASLRILVAEDNRVNQQVALRMLAKLGAQADVAADGRKAVEAVQQQAYDLVLMDLHMPELDGLEATRLIRDTLPAHRQPRIVAMTASAMPEDRRRLLEAGMDDYVSKPTRLDELAAVLDRCRDAHRAGTDPAPTESPSSDTTTPVVPMIDSIRTQLTELAGDDLDFIREILTDYLNVAPDLLAGIDAGLGASDPNQTREAAHTLKSSSGAIGARELQQLCAELEALSRGGSLEQASSIVRRIHETFETLQQIIQGELDRLDARQAA